MGAMPVEDTAGDWLSEFWPKEDRPLTVDDLKRLPYNGDRYELVHGVLEVTPAPRSMHNLVVGRLIRLLGGQCPDGLEALPGNGVNLASDHHRIPDVIVVPFAWIEPTDFIEQPPPLAIEVASNSTRYRDRTIKLQEYEAFGIESYWIVEPDRDRPSLTACELNGRRYDQVAQVSGDQAFQAKRPFPITIVPALLVAQGNSWQSGLG